MNDNQYDHASNHQVAKRATIVWETQRRVHFFNEPAVCLHTNTRPLFKVHLFLCTSAMTTFAPALDGHTVVDILVRAFNLTL